MAKGCAWKNKRKGFDMSEVGVVSDRFWREFKTDVAGTLSDEQRKEIDRVLSESSTPRNEKLGDLRLSFRWFFVRFVWGPEKRSSERLNAEQKLHPPMAARNVPMLASLFAGYMVVWYAATLVGAVAFAYLVS